VREIVLASAIVPVLGLSTYASIIFLGALGFWLLFTTLFALDVMIEINKYRRLDRISRSRPPNPRAAFEKLYGGD
jgi:hypothetical protein